MSEQRLTYSFGPLEQRGLLGPLGLGQLSILLTGMMVAIVTLDLSPSAAGGLGALLLVAGAVAASFLRLGRRPLPEWVPLVLAFLARGATGRGRFRSSAPGVGIRAPLGRQARPPRLSSTPAPLRGVRIVEAAYRERTIGALSEQSGRRLTAVLACRVSAFPLLDSEAQERRLARWGTLLSGAATSPVRRLQWIERTIPAQGDEMARWLHAERDPAVPLRGAPMIESYLELIGTSTQVARDHEILLAVQVEGRFARRHRGQGPCQVLVETAERIAKGLEAAEVVVLGALSAGQLARTLRTAFDPYARAELARLEAASPDRGGLPEHSAWPLGTQERWEHYRSDGAVHATYWIAGWPRVEVSPMFMGALLGRSGAVRTVAVTFEPLSRERSTREVEADITRDRADRDLRARLGQSETARQRQARAAAACREAELVAGHGEVRFSGFITVSGRDGDDLRRACAEVLDQAARARLELHRLYGQQADAFTFTLPLGRGLR